MDYLEQEGQYTEEQLAQMQQEQYEMQQVEGAEDGQAYEYNQE